jgi:hypothetical protein
VKKSIALVRDTASALAAAHARKKRPKGPRHKNPDGTYAPDIYDD